MSGRGAADWTAEKYTRLEMGTGYIAYELLAGQAGLLLAAMVTVGLTGRATPAASRPLRPPGQPVPLLARLLPFTIVPVALWLPLAVVVHLAAGNLCTLAQQALPRVR